MVPHAIEFASPDGLMSVDIVTRCGDGSPLALEVDGETHYTALEPYRPLGHTVLRNSLLSTFGFSAISLPFYEWKDLTTLEAQQTYLASKLQTFGLELEEPFSKAGTMPQ